MVTHITLTFHSDPGHGWVEAPLTLVKSLGIAEKISAYSYQKEDTVYLEEDCDADLLISALKKQGYSVNFHELHQENTFIRSLPGYRLD